MAMTLEARAERAAVPPLTTEMRQAMLTELGSILSNATKLADTCGRLLTHIEKAQPTVCDPVNEQPQRT